MEYKEMTLNDLNIVQVEKEQELQKSIETLTMAVGEKRRIKKLMIEKKKEMLGLDSEIATWIDATDKAKYNKEGIESQLREIKQYIYMRLQGN